MIAKVGILAWALGLAASSAASHPSPRLVVVVGRPSDPRVERQKADLDGDRAALRERDVIVQNLTPEAARRARPELGVGSGATFEVLVVGRDGEVKLRREIPVAVSEIAALIDAMPMRKEEMRRQKSVDDAR